MVTKTLTGRTELMSHPGLSIPKGRWQTASGMRPIIDFGGVG
jgi:hypothetical protein